MINIAIDGVAGCGKSSISKLLAKRLNFKNFNTGLVYRALACHFLKLYGENIDINKNIIKQFLNDLNIRVEFQNDLQKVYINNIDYSNFLREEKVSVFTPKISGFDELREKVRQVQRDFAKHNNCVMEGRDIGRVVLKNATCKFFITASQRVRAERRKKQFEDRNENIEFETILKDIIKRDNQDKNREFGAMIPDTDAIIIDNSNETLEQSVNRCEKFVNEKIKIN